MATAEDVAQWMVEQLESSKHLYQETVVNKIKKQFGKEFVYKNKNGNLAIGEDVLKHFGALTEGKVVWNKSDRSWRKLRENETYKGRQVE